jgi:hypothetical protein
MSAPDLTAVRAMLCDALNASSQDAFGLVGPDEFQSIGSDYVVIDADKLATTVVGWVCGLLSDKASELVAGDPTDHYRQMAAFNIRNVRRDLLEAAKTTNQN